MLFSKLAIIDSTLREGEQSCYANFSSEDKIEIAREIDAFGVEYIEVTSPSASPQSFKDCQFLARLGFQSKILTHIRCNLDDAKKALDTGVDGINIFMATSPLLRKFGHGKEINQVIDLASEVINFIHQQSPQTELRFSTEDSFRSSLPDLLKVYLAIAELGIVDRLGISDTVGVATPQQVSQLVETLRQCFSQDIEFHAHNDTGCAIANSYAAFEAGATHLDTSVLGIGERNGITPLAGLIARLYTINSEAIRNKYNLNNLLNLHKIVANKLGIEIPFNHCIVSEHAFTHKAGVHTKAILNNSNTYEQISPADFGLTRKVLINHKLTGSHALTHRMNQLGLQLDSTLIQIITREIKELAEQENLTSEKVDQILLSHSNVSARKVN